MSVEKCATWRLSLCSVQNRYTYSWLTESPVSGLTRATRGHHTGTQRLSCRQQELLVIIAIGLNISP